MARNMNQTLQAANNYAASLRELKRFEEAKSLIRKRCPWRGESRRESSAHVTDEGLNYAEALYKDSRATLDDFRESVTTLEDSERTARRVLGGAHPLTVQIEQCASARAALRARETPSSPGARRLRTARAKIAREGAMAATTGGRERKRLQPGPGDGTTGQPGGADGLRRVRRVGGFGGKPARRSWGAPAPCAATKARRWPTVCSWLSSTASAFPTRGAGGTWPPAWRRRRRAPRAAARCPRRPASRNPPSAWPDPVNFLPAGAAGAAGPSPAAGLARRRLGPPGAGHRAARRPRQTAPAGSVAAGTAAPRPWPNDRGTPLIRHYQKDAAPGSP